MFKLRSAPIAAPQEVAVDDATRFDGLVRREMRSSPRGNLAGEFREVINPYLVEDLSSDQFLQIHRAASPYPARSGFCRSMSVADFIDFLRLEGPALRDHYLRFKSRGHTGCVIVAEEVNSRLNRRVSDCASLRVTGDGIHHHSIVAVEGRDYVVDFTVDQFVAYREIVERHALYSTLRKVDPPPSYAGALILPLRPA